MFYLRVFFSRTYDQILILVGFKESPVTIQHLLNNWCCFNIFCKRYGDITEHTAEICCYGTHFLLYQVLTKKSIFGAPMIELAYFLHTKLFVADKDSYHSKKKFRFDTFFNEQNVLYYLVHLWTLTKKTVSIKKEVSNLNFILLGYTSLYISNTFVSKK